ncbi:MAG: hypothetical protein HZC49_01085 [Nitrospirae bacterium]|nr:hypothetical protein [Nitrospirota bacterium]
MPVSVFVLGMLSLAILVWMSRINERQYLNYALANSLMDIQIHAATTHLWFEEGLYENKQAYMAMARSNLADAARLSKAILNGGESEHGIILQPERDPDIVAQNVEAARLLFEFDAVAAQRVSHPAMAGLGSDLDNRFDRIFTEFQGRIKALEEIAERKQENDYAVTSRLFIVIFFAWSLIIAGATVGLWNLESRRKRSEESQARLVRDLASANRELDDFASVVSHDLRAPLRAIGSLAGWLATDYSDRFDRQGKEQVDLLINRVIRLDRLINCILEYSRAGCGHEEKERVDLNSLVSNVTDMLSPPASMRIIIEDELPVIMCQRARIEQVFQNLISNAIKFINKPEGVVRISCSLEGEYWKLGVSDNGPGIEEKNFEKIFRIFETLKAKDESEGAGLGLALVKKTVEMYGGRVWVESEAGLGSVFYFTVRRNGP